MTLFAVIMAGGSGTRFWPLSREKMPKQLLKIGGEDTLICTTVSRMLPLIQRDNIFVVTNQALSDTIGYQLSTKFERTWDENFILEPEAKNTAPALGLAALHLERMDPESIMVVLAADHIRKGAAFLDFFAKPGQRLNRDIWLRWASNLTVPKRVMAISKPEKTAKMRERTAFPR